MLDAGDMPRYSMADIDNGLFMKRYEGRRTSEGCVVLVHENDAPPHRLDPRLDLRNHSPTGFEWGYSGSGPAQLALAICADALRDDERALDVYQQFKFKTIGRLPTGSWAVAETAVLRAIDEIENSQQTMSR